MLSLTYKVVATAPSAYLLNKLISVQLLAALVLHPLPSSLDLPHLAEAAAAAAAAVVVVYLHEKVTRKSNRQ